MEVPFTWKPTGWYQIGWSHEFPADDVRPLKYFGEELAAYRDSSGQLHVLQAHCQHLGANLAYGGDVVGDCVRCPFHGWQWGADGCNTAIPTQDKPNRSKRLRVWPVMEQHGLVFMWHHPDGDLPAWEMLDIFGCYPDITTQPDDYYPPFPEFTRKDTDEPVHPQIVLENSADSAHFEYVHRSTVTPRVLHWSYEDHLWYFIAGWPDTTSVDPDAMRLRIHSKLFGLGGAISAFEGAQNYRTVFSTTPVEHGRSDMFYTIWWPRNPGDQAEPAPPQSVLDRVRREFLTTVDDDLNIWRHQVWIDQPAYSQIDAKGYATLRKWSQRFYDVPADA